MPRYIDADALLKLPHDVVEDSPWTGCKYGYSDETIKEQPTISTDEVRGVGKWEDAQQHGLCRCSACKDCYIERDYIAQAKWRYCPNCGAKMEVSEDA